MKVNKRILKKKCSEKGMNFQMLAEKLDITSTSLSNKVGGKTPFTLEEYVGIKKILNLSEEDSKAIFYI